MTLYKVMEVGDGERIDSESGPINVHCEPANSTGEVHIKKQSQSNGRGQCDVTGNTYHRKDIIKKLPYGDDGTKWTGDVWVVSEEQTANLAATLTIAGVDVTIHEDAIASDPEWGYYYDEAQTDEPEGGELVIGPPADADERKVSSGWVETLVGLGYYSDAEEYADRFDVKLLWDEHMMDGYILCRDTGTTPIFDSRKASPF
jgi:hypothetical protein